MQLKKYYVTFNNRNCGLDLKFQWQILQEIFLFFFLKQLDGPFLWTAFNILKATEPLRGGTLLFTTKLPSILSFPKKLLPTIFQFVRIDSKFLKIYRSWLCADHKWLFEEGRGYAAPKILISTHGMIRFSGNPLQKETIDGVIWLRRKKCVIYRLDIIFSATHMAQSMVSKSISSARGIFADIRRGMSEKEYQFS